jgi:hypothetical protein
MFLMLKLRVWDCFMVFPNLGWEYCKKGEGGRLAGRKTKIINAYNVFTVQHGSTRFVVTRLVRTGQIVRIFRHYCV